MNSIVKNVYDIIFHEKRKRQKINKRVIILFLKVYLRKEPEGATLSYC